MKAIKKKFSLSYADLAMFTSNLVIIMTRDATQFATRGVDAADITALEALGNAFEVLPTDEYYVGSIKIEVDEKNILRENAINKIQYISGYFEQKWGINSGEYKQLKISSITTISDNNFLVAARAVVSVATLYIAELTPIGLTQLDIDALETEAQLFEDKMNTVADKKRLRDSKARERIELANELYDYVVLYCRIGKLIWENVNEAMYNDYVIYKKESDTLGKVKNLTYDIPSMMTNWDVLQFADTYQLQYKPPSFGADWIIIYEGADTFKYYDSGLLSFTLRCRGHNSEGYGDWSDELPVIIPSP